jgi:hypothetical protein
MFDLGMFSPFGSFGRNFPTHCLGETPFETVSGRISPKWGKHPQSKMLVGFFLPIGKIIVLDFFLPWDFSWDS